MKPPINTLSPVSTTIRVEILTALEIAQAGDANKPHITAVAAAHPANFKKRLILIESLPQEISQPG
jgi:hypothetical protein